jgi:hypothetical protein
MTANEGGMRAAPSFPQEDVVQRGLSVLLCGWLGAAWAQSPIFQPKVEEQPGFRAEQVDMITYRVEYQGQRGESLRAAEEMGLVRTADLVLQKGYKHFAVIESQAGGQVATGQTAPTTYGAESSTIFMNSRITETTSPNVKGTVRLYQEPPEATVRVFDAHAVCATYGPKYGVVCSGGK